MTTAFRKQTHTFIFSDALVVVAYTPISRSRHFEIESEAPVGRNPEVLPLITGAAMSYCCVPGCTSYQRKECDKELSFHRCPMFFFFFFFFFFTKHLVGFDILHRPIFRHLQY